jgi:hypothetical protein
MNSAASRVEPGNGVVADNFQGQVFWDKGSPKVALIIFSSHHSVAVDLRALVCTDAKAQDRHAQSKLDDRRESSCRLHVQCVAELEILWANLHRLSIA